MSGPAPKAGILDIEPYKPGKAKAEGVENPVKMSANENPLGFSPKAAEAFAAASSRLHLYPDPRATVLRQAIAQRFNLEPERLIFGCGSDEVFQILNQTFLEPGDNMIQGEYGFAAFAIGAYAAGGEVRFAREPNYRIDVDEILALVDERTKLVFVANPANPTGTVLEGREVRRLAESLPTNVVLVLDGAYREFAMDPDFEDGFEMARTAPNIFVTRTFSKLHGLASLRVGWGYGPAELVAAMDRIRLPFNVNIPAMEAAVAALADEEFQARSLEHIARWREFLEQQIGGLGLEVTKGEANFVLVHFPTTPGRTAADADAFLSRHGLLTRHVANYGLPNALRITVGLEADNRALVERLREFLGQ